MHLGDGQGPFLGQQIEGRDRDIVPIHLEMSPQLGANGAATETFGAQHDIMPVNEGSQLLGVHPDTLARFGAVSDETVREMVAGALPALGADVALAISGIAGPDGGTPEKPVGTVWMAVGDRNRIVSEKHVFGRDRTKNIQMAGMYGLNLVRKFLLRQV